MVIELFVYLANENIIEPPEEIQPNNCKESEDYRKGYECGFRTAIEFNIHLKSKKLEPQFKPFDKVLVRNSDYEKWHISLYESCDINGFYTLSGIYYKQCILYDGNEILISTSNKPKED